MVQAHLVAGGKSAGHIDGSLVSKATILQQLLPFFPHIALAVVSWCSAAKLLKVSYAPKGVGGLASGKAVYITIICNSSCFVLQMSQPWPYK